MAYALRYYKELIHEDGSAFRLEIHKKDSTADPIEIGSVIQGLSLEIQGAQGDVDSPIVKTSLSMTFVDASDIDDGQKNGFWQEFYTPDALLWRVKLKAQKANTTGFYTIWEGYVTPDSFSENLVYRGSVNIIARDNIGHMQDFPFDAVGDADGMISLRNLVEAAWEKASVQMNLVWNEAQMMVCDGVPAYNTLMNISQFEEKNWYKAVESALASYGMVMRYIGDNKVQISSLRYMPNQGAEIIDNLPKIEPVFIAGAQREFVPAVRRIEESVDYDIVPYECKPVKDSDFTGEVDSFLVEGDSVNRKGIAWPIKNIQSGSGWCNPEYSLFFNAEAYEFWNDRDNDKSYMWLAANNYEISTSFVRYAEFSTFVKSEANISFDAKFGNPYYINIYDKLCDDNDTIIRFLVVVKVIHAGHVYFLQSNGEWGSVAEKLTIEAPGGSLSIPIVLSDFDGTPMVCVQIHQILTAASERSVARYVPLYSAQISSRSAIREKNSVNTIYNAENNVILSRNPEIGPAFDNVVFPNIIKNGIFYRSGDMVLPARLWAWSGSTPQQMAVYNHLQLICYYATPNNLISGTIVNADLTRGSAIYWWQGKEHLLISGRYNFLKRHIESAVLRGFVRYDDMWGDISGAALPDTEQKSTNDVENNASSRGSSSTYANSTTINIGSSGGASYLNDLMDVNVEAATAQSVLFYTGNEWVPQSLSVLLGGYAFKASTLAGYGITNAYTKTEVNGKITTINGVLTSHDNRIKSLEDMWYLENGVVKSKYPIMSKGYAAGATATADGGGGGIINKESIISALQYTPVNPADLGALAYRNGLSYSEVGVTKEVVTSLIGPATYAPYNASGYLPLGGGTLSNSGANVLTINRTDGYPVIGFSANGTLMGRIGFDTNKAPIVHVSGTYRYIIHSGNVGDYNAGSATKLQTARTIWGQSFDGTADVSGGIYLGTNSIYLQYNNTSMDVYRNYSTGKPAFGYGTSAKGYDSYYCGYAVHLMYGTGHTVGLSLNASGNVTIGDSNLAGTNYKLYVDGNVAAVASDATPRSFRAQNTNGTISLLSSTNRGVYDSTNSRWLVATDGTNSWLSCGSIGIGTETPEYKLDVNGTVRSNTLRVVNNCYITGSTEIGGRLTLAGTDNATVATIAFSRANANYIVVPSGGSLSIAAGESSLSASVAQFNASGYNLISKGATRVDGALTISGTDSATARIVYSRAGLNYIGIPADGTLSIGSAYTNTGNVVNISAADKTSAFNGDIILKSASASADTPRLIFQRGTASDTYYDWGVYNTGGALSFRWKSGDTWTDTVRLRATYTDIYTTLSVSGALTAAGATINGTLNVSSGNVIKIGDATISYENGVLKIDKPLMAKGYAAGATATAN